MSHNCPRIVNPQRPEYNWNVAVNDDFQSTVYNGYTVRFIGEGVEVSGQTANHEIDIILNGLTGPTGDVGPTGPPGPTGMDVSRATVIPFSQPLAQFSAAQSANSGFGNGVQGSGYGTNSCIDVNTFPFGYIAFPIARDGLVKNLDVYANAVAPQIFTTPFDIRLAVMTCNGPCCCCFPCFCPLIDVLVGTVPVGNADPTVLYRGQLTDLNLPVKEGQLLLFLFYNNSDANTHTFNVGGSIAIV